MFVVWMLNCCVIWTEEHGVLLKRNKTERKGFYSVFVVYRLQIESSGTLQFCQHIIWKGEAEQLQNNRQAAILHIYRGRYKKHQN